MESEGSEEGSHLNIWDGVVVAIYFIIVICIGIWSSKKSRTESISGYFLASRTMHWIPVGASLFASNIGSGHFIGLAGSGASSGIGVMGFELSAIFGLMLLGWVFVPVYMSSGIYTMPEYLRERFGGQRIRIYLSLLSLILYIFTKISADLYAGALFIQLALNKTSQEWLYISILLILTVAAVFTIAGGLTAVIWTDFMQTVLMIVGAFILMMFAFAEVGGYQNLIDKFPKAMASKRAGNGSCGIPPADYMNLFRSPYPGVSDLPWTGIVFGQTVKTIWYWCTDQVIVQRTLASKTLSHAKGGCILASYLKLLPLWLLVFPGMIARVLFPDRVGCSDPDECRKVCGNPKGCSNIAYAELVIKLLPSGLSGLMLAVMLAALMSSLTSIFNSASTIFTIDIWARFRKKPSDMELIVVGRVFVVILVAVSVIWIPVLQSGGNSRLFDYIQSISAFLAPPICAVYLVAMFWHRTTEPGAFWGFMVGLLIGMIRFALEYSYSIPYCGSDEKDTRPWFVVMFVGQVHFLHFGFLLFVATLFTIVVVSLFTRPIPEESLYRLTFWTRKSTLVRKTTEEVIITESETQTERREKDASPSLVIQILYKICGAKINAENGPKSDGTLTLDEEQEAAERAVEFLNESTIKKRFASINALICFSVSIFYWIYYA